MHSVLLPCPVWKAYLHLLWNHLLGRGKLQSDTPESSRLLAEQIKFLLFFLISRDLQPSHHTGGHWQNILTFVSVSLELGDLSWLHCSGCGLRSAEQNGRENVLWPAGCGSADAAKDTLCFCSCKGEIHFHSAIHQLFQVLNSRLAVLSVLFF